MGLRASTSLPLQSESDSDAIDPDVHHVLLNFAKDGSYLKASEEGQRAEEGLGKDAEASGSRSNGIAI